MTQAGPDTGRPAQPGFAAGGDSRPDQSTIYVFSHVRACALEGGKVIRRRARMISTKAGR